MGGLSPRAHNALSYGGSVLLGLYFMSLHGVTVVNALWTLHFTRRTAESLLVHKYSGASMPVVDTIIECVYYWAFGYGILGHSVTEPQSAWLMWVMGMLGCELLNGYAHHVLSTQPKSPSGAKLYPRGFFAFDYVSHPHYLFEILGWVCFSMIAQSMWSWLFTTAASAIMATWAYQKHAKYGTAAKGKKALIPFIF
jgi:very-long-chain enoyl-CoA reductase